MSAEMPIQREELLASLICQYDEALRAGIDAATFDESSLATDAELAARFDDARHGLEALDRVRHFWTPAVAQELSTGEHTTADDAAETTDPASRRISRFRIQWELGRGGLGVVFLAYDPKLHRNVALKVPRLESLVSDEMRDRFTREAAAAARLNHPNLAAVYEVGEDAGICYIATEYCPGVTLRQWIAERQRVPARVAARIVRDLSDAMQHAHGRGVLHRDIKPSNVLLERESTDDDAMRIDLNHMPKVKLVDFGMAKLLEHNGDQTRSGAILGTLAYMAPEQAEGRTGDIDIRTDVYGLGAVLYELLTGRPPFQGDTDAEILRQLLFGEVRHPARIRSDVPADLEAICLKCLEKDPRHRYNTAQELGDDLDRFLDGRATEARPLRFPETLWKWVRRRPLAAAIVALMLMLACAVVGTVVVYNAQLLTAAKLADRLRNRAEQAAESRRRLLYSADVRLAYETLKANNVVQAIEALDRQIPRAGEVDLREFAWHHLRRRCEPATLQLTGHENTVFSVVFSPDGRLVASASQDGTARLWDSATGAPLQILRGHATEVTSVAFAPDGRTLATGSEDRTIRVWNTKTGRTIRVLKGHRDHVQAVAFSPDGKWLASGSRDTTVRIWNIATGAVRATLDDDMDVIRAIAFAPSGDKLYAVDEAECLHVWETENWNRVARERADRDLLFALAVSRDGRLVAAAGRRMEIDVWKVDDDRLSRVQSLEGGHSEWIQSLAFSPVDDTLASGGKDGVIRLWDPRKATPRRALLGHKGRVWSVAWAPDGKRLASAGANAAIRLWDITRHTFMRYPAVPTKINGMACSPDGSILLTGTRDGFVQFWNPIKRTQIKTFHAHSNKIADLQFSPDGLLIASAAKGGTVKVWSRSPLKEIAQIPAAEVTRVAWAPRGQRLAIATDTTTAGIVDVHSGKITHRFRHDSRVREVVFTPDGRHLVTTSLSALDVWDVDTGQRAFTIPEGHTSVAVTNDGGAIAAVKGSSVSLVDLTADFRCSTLVTSGVDAKCLAFSPDGNTLAVALLPPAAISFWDRRTGHEMMRLEFDATYIARLAFSPDGSRLLLSGIDADGKGGIWEWSIRKER